MSCKNAHIKGMLAVRGARQILSSRPHLCRRTPFAPPFLRVQASMSTNDIEGASEETEGRRKTASLIPPLGPQLRKGSMGKVVVIGGCEEYTGAPYFAAYAALKMGADLSHVFCTKDASSVIKSYSPELIVHPYLDERSSVSAVMAKFDPWMEKFSGNGTCVVIGPGLGRHPKILEQAKEMLLAFNSRGVPVVVDADGLWMLCEEPDIIKYLQREHVVLTPNPVEHRRIRDTGIDEFNTDVTWVLKGLKDVVLYSNVDDRIATGNRRIFDVQELGSPRRAGGQGDVLTGCIATFIAWNCGEASHPPVQQEENAPKLSERELRMETIARCAHAGCTVTRMASERAFRKHHRAMGAPEVINELGQVIHDLEPLGHSL